ncbi:zinc finger protein 513a [Periophthalmus magnuspinnatus]|uniref:zinc finger protein 513a n=1 Tax=Periophthalmus magnuspinnatus TaxID=409849 RepID=UPI00145A090F|nr:zinc finger protein 513a [Periophthalmus magnuspinnatus]
MPRKKQQNPQPVKLDSEDALAFEVPGSLPLDTDILLGPEIEFDDSDHDKILGLEKFADVAAEIGFSVYSLGDEESSVYSPLTMENTDNSHSMRGDQSRGVQTEHSFPPYLSCRGCGQIWHDPLGPGMDQVGPFCLRCCKAKTTDFCLPFGGGVSGIHSQTEVDGEKSMADKAQPCEDKSSKLPSCHLCGFSSRYANHVKRHMKTHNGEKPFNCPLCTYASAQLVNLQRHLRIHTGEKPYKCDRCNFACSSLGNLKRHQRMHMVSGLGQALLPRPATGHTVERRHPPGQRANEQLSSAKVSQVPRLTSSVTSRADDDYLSAFESLKRASPPPITAINPAPGPPPAAPQQSTDTDRNLPSTLFPFTCRLCGVILEDEDGTSAQICPKCTLEMLTKDSGSPHSPGERSDKVYTCSACPFLTHYPNHLARHMKTHSGEKPYKCPQCDYASAHFDNLKRHHRVHTGEKPFKCHLCEYACGNLANLKRHQRVHSGAKPFQCTVCNYSCNQSMNLKRHMLRHTGEKPYKCEECGYTTGHWDNYKRHQKKHGLATDGWVKVPPNAQEDREGTQDGVGVHRKDLAVNMQYVPREGQTLHSCYKLEVV